MQNKTKFKEGKKHKILLYQTQHCKKKMHAADLRHFFSLNDQNDISL